MSGSDKPEIFRYKWESQPSAWQPKLWRVVCDNADGAAQAIPQKYLALPPGF